MKKKFNVNYLKEELGLPQNAVERKVVDINRKSQVCKIVFEDEGKFWRAWYFCGLAELQDGKPWKNVEEVECTEVKKEIVPVEIWVSVKG